MTTLTGFQLSKVLNAKLEERGLKTIPSQMIYNYMKSEKIAFIVVDSKKRIEIAEARRFVESYLTNRNSTTSSFEELLEEFDAVDEETLEVESV